MRTYCQGIITIVVIAFITSCGEKCKGTETQVRAPENFNQAMHALQNYQ